MPSLRGYYNMQKRTYHESRRHRVRSVRIIRDAPQDVDHVFSVNGMRMAHESAQECEKYRSDRSGACNSSRIRQSRTHKNIETLNIIKPLYINSGSSYAAADVVPDPPAIRLQFAGGTCEIPLRRAYHIPQNIMVPYQRVGGLIIRNRNTKRQHNTDLAICYFYVLLFGYNS